MKRILSSATIVLFALFAVTSILGCTSTPTGWISDYEEGQKIADKTGKDLFLFFSGEDTDGVSTQLRTSIFDTPAFIEAAGKDYVLVHLDFSESRMMPTELAENATEEEKKKAEEQMAQLEKDIDVAVKFGIINGSLPVMLLATAEGYVYGTIAYDATITTPEQFIPLMEENKENQDKIKTLAKTVDSSSGVDKLIAIDELYEATDPTYTYLLADFFGMAAELDPNNESGKRGKYDVLNAYIVSSQFLFEGDVESAINAMLAPIENGFCSDEEKQELMYQAAYFYSLTGDTENMSNYLQQALDLAPESEIATTIKTTLDAYKLASENAGVSAEGME